MTHSNSIFIKIIKNAGKLLILLAIIWLQIALSVILYMKGIPLAITIVCAVLWMVFVAGLLWPSFLRKASKSADRKWLLTRVGLPTAIIGFALYMAVIFYVEDIPVLSGIAAAILLLTAVKAWSKARGAMGKAALPLCRSALRMGLLGMGALLVSVASIPLVENYRANLAKDGEQARQRVIAAQKSVNNPSEKVRIYPIQTGSTTVTYGQFYGGLSGWEGFGGYTKTLTNKDTITVPIVAYLIDHPKHGLMMVDAGINWEQTHDHDGYYNHNYMVSRMLTTRDEYQLAPEQDLAVQVHRLGYKLADIKTVFLTHVHDDHAAGLRNLPNAKVVLDKKDWKDDARYPYSFAYAEKNMIFPAFDSGPFSSFSQSKDYFGDGSVVLIPTPGHSPGHISVSVKMDDQRRAFMTGDTIYTLRHIAVDEVRQIMLGGKNTEEQVDAAHRIQRMLKQDSNTVMLFAHDHTEYQSKYIAPYLADGLLHTQEAQAITTYRDSLFTANWRLKPGNLPYYVPQQGGTAHGIVRFK